MEAHLGASKRIERFATENVRSAVAVEVRCHQRRRAADLVRDGRVEVTRRCSADRVQIAAPTGGARRAGAVAATPAIQVAFPRRTSGAAHRSGIRGEGVAILGTLDDAVAARTGGEVPKNGAAPHDRRKTSRPPWPRGPNGVST